MVAFQVSVRLPTAHCCAAARARVHGCCHSMLSVHGASRPRVMAANTRSPRPHPSNQPDIHVPRSFTARRTSMTACRPHRGALLHAASTSLLPHCFQPATASPAAAPSAAATARLLPHTAAAALPHARRWQTRTAGTPGARPPRPRTPMPRTPMPRTPRRPRPPCGHMHARCSRAPASAV